MWKARFDGHDPHEKFKVALWFLVLMTLAAAATLPFLAGVVRAQAGLTITSGPTAGDITEDAVVIRWTTSEPSTTVVRFGETTALEKPAQRKIIPLEETEPTEMNHSLYISFGLLKPGTLYHYAVRSVTEDGRTVESGIRTFMTSAAPEPEPQTAPEPEEPECAEDTWECGEWGECSMGPKMTGQQVRLCRKTFECPGVDTPPKPAEERWCPLKEPSVINTATEVGAPEPSEEEEGPIVEEDDAPPAGPRTDDVPVETGLGAAIEDFEQDAERVSGGLGLIVGDEDGEDVGASLASAAERSCADGGLSDEECDAFLKKGLGFEDCAAEGIMTAESCDAYLTGENGGVFPGCEGKGPAQCETIKRLTLVEYVSSEAKKEADRLLQEMIEKGLVMPIDGITSITEEAAEDAGWWKSAGTDGAETSAGVIVIDSDGDKLPDDFERAIGTDPDNADSDGDGVSDADELKAGAETDPTALAIIRRPPLEQPRGSGAEDGSFGVRLHAVRAADSTDGGRNENWDFGGRVTLTGTCAPSATCLIYVYSYIPMVLTVKSDAGGNWTYDISKSVADGSHTAYVAVTDPTGKITKKSSPFSFFVKEAQAADEDAFLAPTAADVLAPERAMKRWYVYGAIGLVLLAGLAAYGATQGMRKGAI